MFGHRLAQGLCNTRLAGARGLLSVGLSLLLSFSAPLSAQTLADLVQSATGDIMLPPGPTLGRADINGTAVIRGVDGTVLSAPTDDAILAVLPGARLQLSEVALVQDGQSKFALYVDGGTVGLADCRIEGAFEVSIYVAAGSLTLQNCQIDGGLYGIQAAPGATVVLQNVRLTGQGNTAVRIDGASLVMEDVTVTDAGETGIVAVSAPEFVAEGVGISGILKDGLWLQDAGRAKMTGLAIQVSGQAMTVSGGDELWLEGALLQGSVGALVLDGIAVVSLAHSRLLGGDGATTSVMANVGSADVREVEIVGGDTGLYLTGQVGGQAFHRVFLHSQTGAALFVDGATVPDGMAPPAFTDLRIIALGAAFPAYFRDSGPLLFSRAVLIGDGFLPFAVEGAASPRFESSALITAPEWLTGDFAYLVQPNARPAFLPVGDLALLDAASLGAGTVHLSLADFANSLGPEPEIRQAVANFATGGAFDPRALALALEFVVPLVDAADAAATTEVALAPPEPGWLWDSAAARIALTGTNGLETVLGPGDFPVVLPVGDYSLSVDGHSAGRVSLAPGAILTLPLPDAPFYAWRDAQGQKWRGPALYLRPATELSALLAGFRPLRVAEYWGHAPAFAARPEADRAFAAEVIAKGKAALPGLLAELQTFQAAEQWPDFNRRWLTVDLLLDIMAQFGKVEDAAWLIALPVPDTVQIDQLETAVLIETRLGALRTGAVLPAARAALAAILAGESSQRRTTIRLVRGLARSGLPDGMAMLADLQRALRLETPAGPPETVGIVELSRTTPDLAGDIPALFLDRLEAEVMTYLSGPLPEGATPPLGSDLWTAAVAALAHERVHSPGKTRRLPIPPEALIGPSAWAFADPETLMLGPLATVGPPDIHRLNGWTYKVPEYLCAALSYRTPADRQARLDALRLQVATAVTYALIKDEAEGDVALVDQTFRKVSLLLDLILGECVLSDGVLNSFGRSAAEEEAAIFDQLDYDPLWWVRLPRTRALLGSFAQGVDFPVLNGHSAIPLAEIEALLATGDGGYPPLKEAFLARHRLVTDAFHATHDSLTFGAERRQFRLRNDGGNGSVTIAGVLDIRPILSDGRLILAIRHAIQSPDYGGLAAMITAPDREPYETNNRLLMFEAITLDRGGEVVPMLHEGISATGVHFFAAPWQGDLSDTALHLSMRFWDATWQVDVPLWSSVLAHDLRAGKGEGGP
jgi:hypothetical protein